MNNPKSKSIEELEKDIYKLDKESKTKIKEAIEKNKNLIIDIKSFNISDYPKFEKIFSVIETKIELFDDLILELKKIKPVKRWPIVKTDYLSNYNTKSTNNRLNSQYQSNDKKSIEKHIKYLEYLKYILHTKVNNDVKIMDLFNAIMNNTDQIVFVINKIKDDQSTIIKQGGKLKKNYIKTVKILKFSKNLKENFNDISNLADIKYDKDYLKKINKSILTSELDNFSKQIAENLKNLIDTVKIIEESIIKKGGGVEITNTNIIKKLVEISDNINYTQQLNRIKEEYENGLKQNIDDFKKICKALTEYLKNLQEITKKFLTNFFERSKIFIEKQNEEQTKKAEEIELNKFKVKTQLKKKINSLKKNLDIMKNEKQNLKEEVENKKQKLKEDDENEKQKLKSSFIFKKNELEKLLENKKQKLKEKVENEKQKLKEKVENKKQKLKELEELKKPLENYNKNKIEKQTFKSINNLNNANIFMKSYVISQLGYIEEERGNLVEDINIINSNIEELNNLLKQNIENLEKNLKENIKNLEKTEKKLIKQIEYDSNKYLGEIEDDNQTKIENLENKEKNLINEIEMNKNELKRNLND